MLEITHNSSDNSNSSNSNNNTINSVLPVATPEPRCFPTPGRFCLPCWWSPSSTPSSTTRWATTATPSSGSDSSSATRSSSSSCRRLSYSQMEEYVVSRQSGLKGKWVTPRTHSTQQVPVVHGGTGWGCFEAYSTVLSFLSSFKRLKYRCAVLLHHLMHLALKNAISFFASSIRKDPPYLLVRGPQFVLPAVVAQQVLLSLPPVLLRPLLPPDDRAAPRGREVVAAVRNGALA